MEEKVKAIIEKVRPYIQMHGGDVVLAGIEDGVVTLAVSGKCLDCPWAELTYNNMLGGILKKEVEGIKDVIVEV
jgi:Fe-S cluster biogenesis protein NfuA